MPIVHRIRSSTFIRHNAIYFVGSLIIGVLNYLYYPVLGRLLEPAAFGEVQTLVSLFLQAGIFLSVLALLAINIIANTDNESERNRIIIELERVALGASLVVLLVVVVLAPLLREFFNFESSWGFVLLAVALVATVPFTFRTAYLRGRQQFGRNSVAFIVGAACKLLISAVLVAIGWGTGGAILGIAVAQVLAFLFAARSARKYGFSESLRTRLLKLPEAGLVRPHLKYAGLVLAGSLAITVLYSIDIVVVKHYFDAHTAGLYAGIATVARVLFFLTASIAQVLMPAVRLRQSVRQNQQILLKSLALLLLIGGAALAIFYFMPRPIVQVLMGRDYLTYAGLLPRLSLAIFVISILNLFMIYFIALRRYAAGIIIAGGAALTCGWMQASHRSLEAVVNSLLYGSLTLLAVLAGWTVWHNRKLITARRVARAA